MAQNNKSNKKLTKEDFLDIMTLISQGSTQDAKRILRKYGNGQEAKNVNDLRVKLTRCYIDSDEKRDMDAEFAEIHPHKDFILRHVMPEQTMESPKTPITPINNTSPVSLNETAKQIEKTTKEFSSNCEGNPNCGCNKTSSFDAGNQGLPNIGLPTNTTQNGNITDHTPLIVLTLGLTAIMGLVVIYKKN